jgi:hypothetical protein
MDGFKRLERFVGNIEKQFTPKADFRAIIAHEEKISTSLGGRSVFDGREKKKNPKKPPRQLDLFKTS